MIGTIIYAIACFAAAGVLATLLILTRPIKIRDELKPWKTFIFMWIFCLALPYGYCEFLTRMHGKAMSDAIELAYEKGNFNGPLRYFRLTSFKQTAAKAIIVGSDIDPLMGEESPVMSVNLVKEQDGNWRAASYKILTSGRLNQDSFVFPPYY
jgi:hypothetical protein